MKHTALYHIHKELGASFSEFAGYDMPLWYKSAKDEHLNVINHIGIFDTSHMSMFSIVGVDSESLLNSAFSRDISGLKSGRLIYGLFLNSLNFVIDDAILYKRADNNFMVVVNAGMSGLVITHLHGFRFTNYKIRDFSDKLGKIDIQGPKSLALMEKIYGKELFDKFPYFSFKGDFNGDSVLISRSGYTGEFGFELYLDRDRAPDLWDRLLLEGEEFNITPCGLAARDSLRVGACLPLSHQDIGNWEFCNTPWDFAITEPIVSESSYTYAYVGYDVRKLHGGKGDVLYNGIVVGEVLSCITEASLTREHNKIICINSAELSEKSVVKGLVAGFIKTNRFFDSGSKLTLSDGKRELTIEVVENIRPNRTARKAINSIRSIYE